LTDKKLYETTKELARVNKIFPGRNVK